MGDKRSPEINREVKWFRKRWREGRAAFFSFCIQSSPVSLPLNWGKQGLPWLLGNALIYCADVLSSLVLMYPCWFKRNHLPAFLCELVRSPETSSVWLSSCLPHLLTLQWSFPQEINQWTRPSRKPPPVIQAHNMCSHFCLLSLRTPLLWPRKIFCILLLTSQLLPNSLY